jgi:hypothetical protein
MTTCVKNKVAKWPKGLKVRKSKKKIEVYSTLPKIKGYLS